MLKIMRPKSFLVRKIFLLVCCDADQVLGHYGREDGEAVARAAAFQLAQDFRQARLKCNLNKLF